MRHAKYQVSVKPQGRVGLLTFTQRNCVLHKGILFRFSLKTIAAFFSIPLRSIFEIVIALLTAVYASC